MRGNAEAQRLMGIECELSASERVTAAAAAVGWYTAVAEGGDAEAQHRLGEAYMHGNGVVPDAARAARHYRQAAEQGHAPAMLSLALVLRDGRPGLEADPGEGSVWLRRSADKGHTPACYHLGILHESGDGAELGAEKAIELYRSRCKRTTSRPHTGWPASCRRGEARRI